MPNLGDVWYRAYCDNTFVRYEEYTVVKLTKKGAWLVPAYWNRNSREWAQREWTQENLKTYQAHWITGGGRWASPSKEEALERLKARTRSYVRHCQRRLRNAQSRARALGLEDGRPIQELPELSIKVWQEGGR